MNADAMASACAIACGAHALIYLTDVDGVKDADGAVMRWLDVSSIAADGRGSDGQLAACCPSWKPAPRR